MEMDKSINLKLMTAFSELAKKDADKITVTSLCKKAEVARATFYIYYSDLAEFIDEARAYAVNRFVEQARILLECDASELHRLTRRKNIILSDVERDLLKYFAEGTKYLAFVVASNEVAKSKAKSDAIEFFGTEFYEKNKAALEYFFNGYIVTAFLALVEFDEDNLEREIILSRECFNFLMRDCAE